ncbi:dTDP-4-dehydrorhamnose 3,5-epimerase [Agromyces sp. Root81]|uniref:dTDP-4-dehydrorhamnose 3,5-epimerase family protein n=1 Tax=Agromyces sp. Root81 TaxID=1736601 RepID=UPI0006F8700B|nr:dTDP-4-dehydrorhamnose 3,5-epimerase [Agromyces sp. Root81]KRC60481.1 dTDP-4-dehydrorhamnose 3,5-epimerase [Agromyces sp. Root81]
MQIRELMVPDSYVVTPRIHSDDRGSFIEFYRHDRLHEAVGHSLDLRQGNTSVSRRGSFRGIHFADTPPGQAKYVTVAHGAILDFVVDLRVGSPTFGTWDSVRLDAVDRRAVYVSEGLGHAFLALEDETVVTYLVSDVYNPTAEHAIDPLDPSIGFDLPIPVDELLISPKDQQAPSLTEALELGILPDWSAARAWYASLETKVQD